MDEGTLHRLLERATADEPPIGPVVDRAIVEGTRIRRRRRRTIAGTIGCVALAAVAGVLVPVLRGPHPAAPPASEGAGSTVSPAAAAGSCGVSCEQLYLSEFGTRMALDVYKQARQIGTPVIMFRATAGFSDAGASTDNPGEDWMILGQKTVLVYYQAGLLSEAIKQHYSTDKAYEIEYLAGGSATGLCLGVPAGAANTTARLEPCGLSAKTVWISTAVPRPGHPVPMISGLDKGFTDPLVLTYPAGANPLSVPRVQLVLEPSLPGRSSSNQKWE